MRVKHTIIAALLIIPADLAPGQLGVFAQVAPSNRPAAVNHSLAEIRDCRLVYVTAGSTYAISVASAEDDTRYASSILSELSDEGLVARRRNVEAYKIIRSRLQKYSKRYRSVTLVERPEEAEFVIVFWVWYVRRLMPEFGSLEETSSLPRRTYPHGELLVIKRAAAGGGEPGIVGRTTGLVYAQYAIEGFIRELKKMRGER